MATHPSATSVSGPRFEDLHLEEVSAEGTHFAPEQGLPFQHDHYHSDGQHPLREAALDQIEQFAFDEPNVAYCQRVVHVLTARIHDRGGCSFHEADVLREALLVAIGEAVRAVALRYVTSVAIDVDMRAKTDDE